MHLVRSLYATLGLGLILLPLACASASSESEPAAEAPTPAAKPVSPKAKATPVQAPVAIEGKVYDFASTVQIPPRKPAEYPGLHNVFFLSENIISGSEPHGEEALVELQRMGVKTILSVDGSEPDAEHAAALGMRYVHVPIQYKGITEDETLRIAKTFRELEGPFYVHCFHGKHRGPAAAAIGRVVLDGAPRETAVAEMRQYCGTSKNYEGLYRAVAVATLPDAGATSGFDYGFESVHAPKGVVGAMVPIARSHDHIEVLVSNDWAIDPEHPDVDALNEARKLEDSFRFSLTLEEVVKGKQDQLDWFKSSLAESTQLVAAIERMRAGDTAASDEAKKLFKSIKATCNSCHEVYRN